MRKYLQTVYDRLSAMKSGITLNAAAWTGQPDTPATVQTEMDALAAIDAQIQQIEDAREQKVAEARALAAAKDTVADAIETRARAIHISDPQKLNEYDIKAQPSAAQPKPIPGKAVIASIADDDDGIGFKVKLQRLPDAEYYEVQRGSLNGQGTVLQPPYPFLRTSRKTQFVDDDVESGTRYFYRVRGVNATGAGAWSEPVSAVQ